MFQHQISVLSNDIFKFQEMARKSDGTVRELQSTLDEMSLSSSRNRPPLTEQGENEDATRLAEIEAEQLPKDWEIVRDELKRQAGYLRTLESTNAKLMGEVIVLKQRVGNAEILKEEKRALERKLEGVEKLRVRCAQLEREVESVTKEREAVLSSQSGRSSRADARQVAELRMENARLLEQLGHTKSELGVKEAQVEEHRMTLASLKTKMEVARKNISELELRATKAETKLEVEKRQCGYLKAMVVSIGIIIFVFLN
jgi:mitotic spindle assembly checkpoint protein MAD1